MPTFFVIGAAKCGTTSLHHYLDLHPEISMSSIKEPNYFSDARNSQVIGSIRSRASYFRLFEDGFHARGEASTSYSMFPLFDGVPEAIAAEVPDAKFVYLVRDPIERLRSMAGLVLSLRFPPFSDLPLDSSIEQLLNEGEEGWQWLTCGGLYMSQISRYLDCFGEDSILVVDSTDMLDRRTETLVRIHDHVGVDPGFTSPEIDTMLNVTESNTQVSDGYRRLANYQLLRSVSRRLPNRLRWSSTLRARRLLRSRRPKRQLEIEAPLRSRLQELYGPEVDELRRFTGEPFSKWSV